VEVVNEEVAVNLVNREACDNEIFGSENKDNTNSEHILNATMPESERAVSVSHSRLAWVEFMAKVYFLLDRCRD